MHRNDPAAMSLDERLDELASLLAAGVEGIDFAGIELREVQEIEIARLRAHAEAGRSIRRPVSRSGRKRRRSPSGRSDRVGPS